MKQARIIVTLLTVVLVSVIGLNLGVDFSARKHDRVSAIDFVSPYVPETPIIPGNPQSLTIPRLNLTVNIEPVSEDVEGRMGIPKNEIQAGWWSKGAKPGEAGNAVLAGHLDRSTGGPGIFYALGDVEAGDSIIVTDDKGNTFTFTVTSEQTFKDATFPLETVFGAASTPQLNLITCSGFFNQTAQNYTDRLVVFATLTSIQ